VKSHLTTVLLALVMWSNPFHSIECAAEPPVRYPSTETRELFQKPLITGASVSANYGTASPGRRAALRFTSESDIYTIAQGGTPGRLIALHLDHAALKGRSVIIAMDLFFWDSTLANPESSLRAVESVIQKARSLSIPVLIGDIPELLPGRQPAREIMNAQIHSLCTKERGCYVWELDKLHRQVIQDGFLAIAGRQYRMSELVPDGLHLSDLASEFLADRLLEVFRR
jgi:hypothetical protein